SGDVNSYAGSAYGNYTYTTGTPEDPWDQVGHQWVFDSDGGARDALVIEVRLYSLYTGPDPQDYWIDDLEVTTSSATATITFPSAEPYGACCDGAVCAVTTEATCIYGGGTYLGAGTSCTPNPCGPTGSCCSADYSCVDGLTVEQCAAADPGATWVDGGSCAVDCVAPTGSCCLLDGTCALDLTEAECSGMRGRQWTEGATDCVPACEAATPAPIIISEYYESAPGYRKAVEIFNTSPEPVSLYGHALGLYANYATVPTGVYLLDDMTIGGLEVQVFINSDNPDNDIPNFDEATAVVAPSVCNFNGDDAVSILFGDVANNNIADVLAVPGERDDGPRGSDPYKDSAWERNCDIGTGVADFDSCNFDGLKDCTLDECPPGTPVAGSCDDGLYPDQWTFEGLNPYNDNGNHSLGVHDAACLDIKPGSCPNSFNRKSRGALHVVVCGSEFFDATMIDIASIRLARADGVGAQVAPHEGPPGPHSFFDDLATPYHGESCHELGADGYVDLQMHFKNETVTAVLGLDALPPGALVELYVSGNLVNGVPFTTADDRIRLVPPGTPPGLVAVSSTIPEVWIDAYPLDLQLDDGGFADFERSYPQSTVVTYTAPRMADGVRFAHWEIDGQPQARGQTVIDFEVVGEVMDVKAVYRNPGLESIQGTPVEPIEVQPIGGGMQPAGR
ncbi:MAG: lamin tail domain-containing protein, partial [Phycisphaerales bacterium]